MKAKRLPLTIRIKAYEVAERAVEEGCRYGLMRAYNYTDEPSKEAMVDDLVTSVMAELVRWFDFGENGD